MLGEGPPPGMPPPPPAMPPPVLPPPVLPPPVLPPVLPPAVLYESKLCDRPVSLPTLTPLFVSSLLTGVGVPCDASQSPTITRTFVPFAVTWVSTTLPSTTSTVPPSYAGRGN